ncbi:class II glutamine amidotransferase [Stappia sp. F7233]|uniref:Class II glutamine amidotransferase n=1 Tax=Stappia albiluteola TaxID=2758565 RepID=A0A839ACD5_9HYPH|nr:class II glutamine amidotransferase [Stappia albiluteola]MBA5777303.1 class II glutamine amidotransferase [Stappia albiluteola]
MCRWLAYQGAPIFLADLVSRPGHSLIAQSRRCAEAKVDMNGDGFGLGWYGECPEPGLYRDVHPAWSDENLLSLTEQIRSRQFFAHVRASTGTATSRANCHPFRYRNWLFMHNGQIGGYERIRRKVEALIDDRVYPSRSGTTDSEAIFLSVMSRNPEEDPLAAVAGVLDSIFALMREAGIEEPLRFTAALADGDRLLAIRMASDGNAPSLYWRRCEKGLSVVSEPLDQTREGWRAVPAGHALVFGGDGDPVFKSLGSIGASRAA